MKKTIKVVYDLYRLLTDGNTEKVTVWDEVPFGKNNVEYDDGIDYQNNVEIFVNQIMEEGIVYIGDGRFIPSHNIHGFYFSNNFSTTSIPVENPENPEKPVIKPSQHGTRHFEKGDVKNFGKYKKIRHKNRHNRQSNQQPNHGSSSLPFNVEKDKTLEVTPEVVPVQDQKQDQT